MDRPKHTTQDGVEIYIDELKTGHLVNIVKWIERRAKAGVYVRDGGGSGPDDMWCDEDVLYGEDALYALDYDLYKKELDKRAKTWKNTSGNPAIGEDT